jgi:hypothetical protein
MTRRDSGNEVLLPRYNSWERGGQQWCNSTIEQEAHFKASSFLGSDSIYLSICPSLVNVLGFLLATGQGTFKQKIKREKEQNAAETLQ